MKNLLDFMIIGCQRCGTSSLFSALCQHPKISSFDKKEAHFFDDSNLFSPSHQAISQEALNRYHSEFSFHPNKLTGEASPSYIFFPNCLERIKSYNPNIRLIVCLRNPIDRLLSHYQMTCSMGFEDLELSEALRMEAPRWIYGGIKEKRRHSYSSRGFYSKQLFRMYDLFDASQVLVLKSESIWSKPYAAVSRVFSFLGLPSIEMDSFPHISHHKKKGLEQIPLTQRQALRNLYKDELDKLSPLVNFDIKDWRDE